MPNANSELKKLWQPNHSSETPSKFTQPKPGAKPPPSDTIMDATGALISTPMHEGSTPDLSLDAAWQQERLQLQEQLLRLQEENRALSDLVVSQTEELEALRPGGPDAAERIQLAEENDALREQVQQLQDRLEEAAAAEKQHSDREQDYDRLLEGKTDKIRELHSQLQEAKQLLDQAEANAGPPVTDEELQGIIEEFEKERAEFARERSAFDRERKEFKEDEISMRQQLREMELQMSKERADMARQRHDLQRLHDEVQRIIESAGRDNAMRKQLEPIYKLQEEILNRRGGDSTVRKAAPPSTAPQQQAPSPGQTQQPSKNNRRSGFFTRLFGRDES